MKKREEIALRILAGTAAAAVAALLCVTAYSDETQSNAEIPETSAYAYCLYCANNGENIAANRETEKLPMASTTKIMTAILGLEAVQRSGEDMYVTVTPDMYAEGSSMYLEAGETVSMNDLVGGMLMVSGNDAANAVALTVGGSFEGFAELMNEKARDIGISDTHFVTPSGLDAQEHYSTASDLCRLLAYCMENDEFAQIDKSRSITVDFKEPQGKSQTYYNENKLLSQYEFCIAGKTGYTDKAGRTLVSCAEKDGVRLICATLNDGDDWNDHSKLFDYGFEHTSMSKPQTSGESEKKVTVPVVGGTSEYVEVQSGEPPLVCVDPDGTADVTVSFELPHFVYAPVEKGSKIGELKYYTGGVYAGKSDVLALQQISPSNTETTFLENISSFFHRAGARQAVPVGKRRQAVPVGKRRQAVPTE